LFLLVFLFLLVLEFLFTLHSQQQEQWHSFVTPEFSTASVALLSAQKDSQTKPKEELTQISPDFCVHHRDTDKLPER